MSECRERFLGKPGVEWIRGALDHGQLASLIKERFDLAMGRVTTLLPEGVSDEQANQFEDGGVFPAPPYDTQPPLIVPDEVGRGWRCAHPYLAQTVRQHLRRRHSFVIFEDRLAAPGDPWLASSGTKPLIFEEAVYHVLRPEDAETALVESTICAVDRAYPPLLAVLGHLANAATIRALSWPVLRELVDSTEKLAVGAYDGEGFLLWHRS